MKAERQAFAKINLTLEVGDKRADGYHGLTSVMARITLADRVTVEENSVSAVRFFTDTPNIDKEDNLCTRMANAYFKAKNITGRGVDITLETHIPTASGMGGGSADSASVLECMEELYGKLEGEVRHAVARSIGADVPYCLNKTPCLCTGIGDECQPLKCASLDGLWLTVSKVGEKLSTGKVYADYDSLEKEGVEKDHTAVINALEKGDVYALAKGVFNDFERVVLPSSPEVARERDRLTSLGATGVVMSGAGPTLVAFFDDYDVAVKCSKEVYKIIA